LRNAIERFRAPLLAASRWCAVQRLFFGDFLLAPQKKVTPPPGGTPGNLSMRRMQQRPRHWSRRWRTPSTFGWPGPLGITLSLPPTGLLKLQPLELSAKTVKVRKHAACVNTILSQRFKQSGLCLCPNAQPHVVIKYQLISWVRMNAEQSGLRCKPRGYMHGQD
jgi:hypothetical protein